MGFVTKAKIFAFQSLLCASLLLSPRIFFFFFPYIFVFFEGPAPRSTCPLLPVSPPCLPQLLIARSLSPASHRQCRSRTRVPMRYPVAYDTPKVQLSLLLKRSVITRGAKRLGVGLAFVLKLIYLTRVTRPGGLPQ